MLKYLLLIFFAYLLFTIKFITIWKLCVYDTIKYSNYLVAFAVLEFVLGVGKMNMAACLSHYCLGAFSAFSNDVRMVGVRDIDFELDPIPLKHYELFH